MNNILYAGDTSISTAGAYLGGILAHANLPFDYLASDEPIGPALTGQEYELYIISDYPVNNWRAEDFEKLRLAVERGAGLLMLGGWESYFGMDGNYHNTPLAEMLPVVMQNSDDRVQSRTPYVPVPTGPHPIVEGLAFDKPPVIGGFNRIRPKESAEVVLNFHPVDICAKGPILSAEFGPAEAGLVVGRFGRGRTVAWASDVAPHWVGTLVDWGLPRITARASVSKAQPVEIGCHYAEFFTRITRWALGCY